MAREVIWSLEALSDLETIADYIAKDSPFYASSFVRELKEISRSLATLSERGRIVPEFDQSDIREIFVKKYRLIYQIKISQIKILTLVHGARDFSRTLS